MPADSLRIGLLVALATLPAGCATHAAPTGFLPDPAEAGTDALGSWIQLMTRDSVWVTGELIAVAEDSVWVLPLEGPARAVATDAVSSGKVVAYDAEHGRVVVATLLGTGSTISNGFFLVFTGPLWLLVGTIAAVNQSRAPVHELPAIFAGNPEDSWSGLALFARFPQGLPPGLPVETLRPRPVTP